MVIDWEEGGWSAIFLEEGGEAAACAAQVGFDGALGEAGDGRYAGYGEVFVIKQLHYGPLWGGKGGQHTADGSGGVVAVVDCRRSGVVGWLGLGDLREGGHRVLMPQMGQKLVVGYAEEPGAEARYGFERADG